MSDFMDNISFIDQTQFSLIESDASFIKENGKIVSPGKKCLRLKINFLDKKIYFIAAKRFEENSSLGKKFVNSIKRFCLNLSFNHWVPVNLIVDGNLEKIYLNIKSLCKRFECLGLKREEIIDALKNSTFFPFLETANHYSIFFKCEIGKSASIVKQFQSFGLSLNEINELITIVEFNFDSWKKNKQIVKISHKNEIYKRLPRALHFYPKDNSVWILFNKGKDPLIGEGITVKVNLAINLFSGEEAVRKALDIYEGQEKILHKQKLLKRKGIAKLVQGGAFISTYKTENEERKLFRLEYLEKFYNGGDLCNYLQKISISEIEIYVITYQLLSVVKYLHKQGFLHRDLKTENIFLVQDSSTKEITKAVVGDLFTMVSFKKGKKRETAVGTPEYFSPEYYTAWKNNDGKKINEATTIKLDAWAMGLILLQLHKKRVKIWNNLYVFFPIEDKINNPQWLPKPKNKDSIEYGIWKLLRNDPEKRWSVEDAFNFAKPIIKKFLLKN